MNYTSTPTMSLSAASRRSQIARLWVFLILSTGLCPRIASQDSSTPTFYGTASEVRLVFFASDEHNRTVQNLTADDFAVVDDDQVIRNFRSFAHPALTNLDVVVLFDSSESVLPHFQQEITEVLQLISQWPWKPEDDVSVLSFSGMDTHEVCAGDCRTSLTAQKIVAFPAGGATPLFDALDTATSLLRKRSRPNILPVMILFSDGDDTISKTSLNRALEKTLAAGVQVYVVDVNPSTPASNGTATLQKIADASGGLYIRSADGIARIFCDVIDDLRSALVVTYALPRSSSDFHSIRILPTHNLDLRFRTRSGYFHSAIAYRENHP
jgi:VWFA-related protein